jgi:hypothetical protein
MDQPRLTITNPPIMSVVAPMKIAVSNGVIIQLLRMVRPQFWTVRASLRFEAKMLKSALVWWTSPLGQIAAA